MRGRDNRVILLIDNFDSFVHNLARHLRRLGQETLVVRNDEVDVTAVRALRPCAIVLSPGPCTPNEAGCCLDVVRVLGGEIPILGVCLGHQAIGQALGATIVRAPDPMHGRSSAIDHDSVGLFAGLPRPLLVGRYHSLAIDPTSLPADLKATAHSADGVVMGIAHRSQALFGVQFHPESTLTQGGYRLLANFLRLAGLNVDEGLAALDEAPPAPVDDIPRSAVPYAVT